MKKFYAFLAVIFTATSLFAVHVPFEDARNVATTFYGHYVPGNTGINDSRAISYKGMTTYYCFNFKPAGFVLIAADDASIPVLGYSFENSMPQEITNPSTKEWLDNYSQEISSIIRNNLDNKETLKSWDQLRKGIFPSETKDVNPLLVTTWDQGCYYNTLCPADAQSFWSCGHTYTGCVATAMTQIMKYHNFPPQGVGTHTYTHDVYGLQTADFGSTTYNWASMPNNVTNNNTAVATIMYHAGVSVNMDYAPDGSGAYSEDVPFALMNYFNYQPGIEIKYKNNYPNVTDFENLIRAELDQQLPLYYSGSGSGGGHAWVCDGYRLSDGKFHFNWGWSGSSNGWYTIGNLNPGGSSFNDGNAVVLHIKPNNANMIVRFLHPVNNAVIGVGYAVEIEAATVRGTPSGMKLFIDNNEVFSTSNDTLIYTWNTNTDDLGSHFVKVISYNAADTGYYSINLNVAEWITQSSGFTVPSRGINYLSAVDSNIVWGSAFDVNNPTGACEDFTHTDDGGDTWIPGTITNTAGLSNAMIFAISDTKAYVPMYKVSGSKPQGIYMTEDAGLTWNRQTSASFSNSASFPNCVHFFNENDGWCMGDPIGGEYEIYTTTNGGTTWTQVSGSNIPNPVSGEFGVVGYYSAVNDTVWFGTNKGRVYRSTDKGLTYTVSVVTPLNGKYIKPYFRNGSHGLVQDKDAGTTGTLCESFDGGVTWSLAVTTGPVYATDHAYVPGTENTWVTTGSNGTNGTSYSFNGGQTWTDFSGTQGAQYMQMTWVNNHCGWAGGVNVSETEAGIYKYIGFLMPPLPSPTELTADVIGYDVNLTWIKPSYDSTSLTLEGYNMYRDGLKLNSSLITGLSFDDLGVPSGHYTYCVKAMYNAGESTGNCATTDIAVSVTDLNPSSRLWVSPNPASSHITIQSIVPMKEIRLTDFSGREVYHSQENGTSATIKLSVYPEGIYFLTVITKNAVVSKKVVVRH